MAAPPKTGPGPARVDPPAQVKNRKLLKERRLAVIEAAVELFTAHGFHKTTTRRIAQKAGMGVGSLYDYVRSKEDILFLVTEHIHGQVEERLKATLDREADPQSALAGAVGAYIRVCDDLSDDILLIYQESKSLPPRSRRSMLEREVRISGIFEEIIRRGVKEGVFRAGEERAALVAEDIVVLGHMWTFRRWRMAGKYDLEEYIRLQTGLVLGGLGVGVEVRKAAPDRLRPGPEKAEEGPGLENLLASLRNF